MAPTRLLPIAILASSTILHAQVPAPSPVKSDKQSPSNAERMKAEVESGYANAPIDHLGGLKRGQVVTTGSLCGLVRLTGQTSIRATWGDIAALDITLPE